MRSRTSSRTNATTSPNTMVTVLTEPATEAAPFTNEQALLWHRARQVHAAMRGLEDALAQSPPGGPNLAQKASMGMVRKLSFDITRAREGGGAATPTTQSKKAIATVASTNSMSGAEPTRPSNPQGVSINR